ncbi:cytochrome p450 monooxygenase [Colletotrichum truncatum]|uniref:Cytochrome p450 monooxygenase n=1 Tax=Colletotrichum truncatum TaxID=5467 RepID=A0ACC3ZKW2_COLTU|nr:cytochrome p450 monooxygenase [Colletotrichum truncatum]KAF6786877.1 cytochrome p450 monooxygenase [Colletotrichum truncatum]
MEIIETPKHLLSSWSNSFLFRRMDVWTSLCLGVVLISIFSLIPSLRKPSRKLPYINPRESLDLFNQQGKNSFLFNARKLMESGRQQFPGQPYRIMTDVGETVVIPSDFVNDIRNEPGLSFMQAFADNFHPHLPGFEAFAVGNRPDGLFQKVIMKYITKLLNQITEPLSSEAKYAVDLRFGNSNQWREFNIKDDILDVISRLSSRVFLGAEVCRDEAWLHITKSYTVNGFLGAEIMRGYPIWIRRVAHWFVPQCKVLRHQMAEARNIIEPVLQKRRDMRARAQANGEPIPRFNDGLDWFEEASNGCKYDAGGAQLGLSAVAIHTTTDLLVETMLRIAENPDLFGALRKEIVDVLSVEGWRKTALYNMKITDSVLKEAQRLKPVTSAIMSRVATRPVTLPNGLQLQTGERCVADLGGMFDPSLYENPEAFDGYRFVRMRRNPKLEKQAHLVSTAPSHLGFGHGQHACPGRFFASNELKIALAHLVMKYDWKLQPGYKPCWQEYGFVWSADGAAKLLMRRREAPEIDIDAL